MPTTTRLVAAILFGALGWGVATLVIPYLPDGKPPGYMQHTAAGFGILVGWAWAGVKIETRSSSPLGFGFVGAVLTAFWTVLALALYEMLQRATNVSYGGPVAALQDMIAIAMGYVKLAAQLDVLIALGLGGILAGAIAGWVARRFR